MARGITRLHLIGIGGSGMSGIAEILVSRGYLLSGSDSSATAVTEHLKGLGIRVEIGHRAENTRDAEVIVVSSAIAPDNPEILAARERGIPIVRRAEMLAELMRFQHGIAVSGSHGKTTTTSLIATLLHDAKLDPTVIVGGKLIKFGSHAHPGKGEYFVAEADESDRSFLNYSPAIAVVTNIDLEHVDTYRTLADLEESFLAFLTRVPFYGVAILCSDSRPVMNVRRRLDRRVITYGLTGDAMVRATGIEFLKGSAQSRFQIVDGTQKLGSVTLNLVGMHNVQNALATFCVGQELGIPFATFQSMAEQFSGVERRFHRRGEFRLAGKSFLWIDDYAHHPTEVSRVVEAARNYWEGPIVVLFQPHRFSRVRALMNEFSTCFAGIDQLLITEIYPAGERPIPHVTSAALIDRIREHSSLPVELIQTEAELITNLERLPHNRFLFISMGAGKIDRWTEIALSPFRSTSA